ncbi:hypothetical protein SCLCIDRAFT_1223903 [Scleroderma citrinum Foug A]|uniref:Uncharacterized protein n=1 Tax=Scleroderma citrinum Foug A TaxID=1036808 RepID=A0A0C3D7D2_9AGAM|nr:hypothetical protein SCLCIDRAFT_1223903 [Scleroderma citrinum Foug A]
MVTVPHDAKKLAPSRALHGNQPVVPPLVILLPERYVCAVWGRVVPQTHLETLRGEDPIC